jgi:hypothetical protein
MSSATKRLLHAAEARMSATGAVINRTPEQAAHLARWGLSGQPVASMPPSDIRTLGRMFAGAFPPTMTADDIAEFGQINELFEKECKWTQKIEC